MIDRLVDSKRARRRALAWSAPALALALLWVYGPLAATFGLSFYDWNLTTRPPSWVGIDHYRDLLTSSDVREATVTTAISIVVLAALAVVAPLVAAMAVWKRSPRLTGLYRTAFFLPVVVPPAAAAVVWEWLIHPVFGVANWALGGVGFGPYNWLNQPVTALGAVLVVTGWKSFGLGFVLFSAGLTMIDRSLLDAARLDGATEYQLKRFVVLPLLRPTTAVVAFMAVVLGSQWTFSAVDVMTGGGPAGATTNLFYLQYRQAFDFGDSGRAAALAVLLVVVFGSIGAWQLRRDQA